MDSQKPLKAWTVWLVHVAEAVGGKPANFTVVNLMANASYDLMTLQLQTKTCDI